MLSTTFVSFCAKIDYMNKGEEFVTWLQNELIVRNWSQSDLAREADISRQAISNVINTTRSPGADVCKAIARAFKIDPKYVFIKAGLLPKEKETNQELEELNYKISQLSEAEQCAIKDMVDFYISKKEKEDRIALIKKGALQP